jgi:hypothetical protein
VGCTGEAEKFRSSAEKDFFNSIRHNRTFPTARGRENSLSPAALRITNRNRERSPMISRRTSVLAFTAGTFLAGVSPVFAKSRHSNWIRMFDTDNDGTVDLAEAKKAASVSFDKLDRDHDGTLDKRELARRLKSSPLPILTTMERSRRTSISRSSSSVSLAQI